MEIGTHHKMNPRTLHLFFADCAWRENERRTHPITRFTKALQEVASAGVCRAFKKCGYEAVPRNPLLKSKVPKPRKIELRPIQCVGAAMLQTAQDVLGGLVRFAEKIDAFLKVTRPPVASAFSANVAEQPTLWDLGRRKRKPQATNKTLLQSLMSITAPAPATPVYSFTVSGMLANCLRE